MTAILPGRRITQDVFSETAGHDTLPAAELSALGSLPRQVRELVGQNEKGSSVYQISQIGSTTVRLTASGQTQATRYSTLSTGSNDVYRGPRITSSEVAHRQQHGQWLSPQR